jgi:hypothetical protein
MKRSHIEIQAFKSTVTKINKALEGFNTSEQAKKQNKTKSVYL